MVRAWFDVPGSGLALTHSSAYAILEDLTLIRDLYCGEGKAIANAGGRWLRRFDSMTIESVKNYYGKVLSSNKDLKTTACCSAESFPEYIGEALRDIHPEVTSKFYGCGSPVPPELDGKTVLDLGSGSGRDCFILSKLVGSEGKVIGVDMTQEQLAIAKRHVAYHTEKFGYSKPNVEFIHGCIEDLAEIGIRDNSIDIAVSNCVINLSPAKERVFSEIFRVLKPGGEFCFSDVFSDRRIPEQLAQDPVLLGECLGGATYVEDFRRMLARIGCLDWRVVSRSAIMLSDKEVERKAGMIGFSSLTVRAFKLKLEDRCEDFGQVAYYLGTISGHPHRFELDDHHTFHTGRPKPVCGNTASMLTDTRYSSHFKVTGDAKTHYGLFGCGPKEANSLGAGPKPEGSCC